VHRIDKHEKKIIILKTFNGKDREKWFDCFLFFNHSLRWFFGGTTQGWVCWMKIHPNFIHEISCTKIHDKVISFMLVSYCVNYVGFINNPTTFFIDVLTWCGQQKVLKTLLYQFGIPFIDRECQWHYRPPPSWGVLLLRGRVLSGLESF